MLDKKLKRKRRATKTRATIRKLGMPRLCVGRSGKHLYAQVIVSGDKGDRVLASASTLEKDLRAEGANSNNVASATVIGKKIAERAIAAGVTKVGFDRSGFRYHGCVKALAEAAREAELFF